MSKIAEYMGQNWREFSLGVAGGSLVFLILRGYNVFPLIIIGALLVVVLMYSRLGGAGPGKGLGLTSGAAGGGISFDDIGGQSRAIRELRESLDLIIGVSRASELGIRPLRGLLLVGPPGTGKTMLARAAANYTGFCFMATSGSEFVEMYAGVGAQRVREVFNRARKKARKQGVDAAMVFIDELEIVGGKRGRHSSHLEYDQTLNQLLVEMDGIDRDEKPRLLIVGATNRRDLLDEALLRPGRFDRIVHVDVPDSDGRREILSLHMDRKPLAEDVDLDAISRETYGFSGAHLESLANEAAIKAFREDCVMIEQRHLLESVEKVIMGERIDRRPSKRQLERVAVHELGHAVIGEVVLPGTVASINITPRGGSLGYVRKTMGEDKYLYTAEELIGEIRFVLGGCAAEQVLLGESSTGVSGDFSQASSLARKLVFSGMSRAGIVSEDIMPDASLDELVGEILNGELSQVVSVIASFSWIFDVAVPRLLEKERLGGEEFRRLLTGESSSKRGTPSPMHPSCVSC